MKIENYENIQLIIFDCDGVLIDSETISAKVISMQFSKLGIDIDTQYVQKHFVGQSYLKVKGHVLKNFDIQLADITSLEVLKERLSKINSMTATQAVEAQVNILQSKIHSRSQELIRLDKDILYLGTRVSKTA